jgi:YVTN family beta-propeller protein
MDYRILGPLEVVDQSRPLSLGGSRQRALLALLLLHPNEVVSTDRLLDELWREQPPESGPKAVQVLVSQLRKALQDSGGDGALVTQAPGYVMRVGDGELDRERFESLVEQASAEANDETRATLLREALGIWRGPPLADLSYEDFAQPAIARLSQARLAALEDRIEADLALGRHSAVTGELEQLVTEHPLRERLRGQLMLALYRSGRQADALAVYQAGRRTLVDELGVEPSPELRQLQKRILDQDSALGEFRKERSRDVAAPTTRRRGRLLLLTGLAAVAAVAAILAAVLLTRGSDAGSVAVSPNSVAVIDPSTNRVTDDVALGGESPGPIDVNDEGLWILNLNSQTLSHVDPRTREVRSTQGIGGTPDNMAAAGHQVWVIDSCNSNTNPSLFRYEHGSPGNFEEVSLPPASGAGETAQRVACGLTANEDSAWAGMTAPASVVQAIIDPALNIANADAPIALPGHPTAIALGEAAVWVADYSDSVVYRVDLDTGKVDARIRVGAGPISIAVGLGAVWVANQNDGSVSRIDPRTNAVVKAISVGALPHGIAIGAEAVWVANAGDGTVSRLDVATNSVASTISVGHRPQGIAVAGDLVWVTVRT